MHKLIPELTDEDKLSLSDLGLSKIFQAGWELGFMEGRVNENKFETLKQKIKVKED
jgi:hypothetical protein